MDTQGCALPGVFMSGDPSYQGRLRMSTPSYRYCNTRQNEWIYRAANRFPSETPQQILLTFPSFSFQIILFTVPLTLYLAHCVDLSLRCHGYTKSTSGVVMLLEHLKNHLVFYMFVLLHLFYGFREFYKAYGELSTICVPKLQKCIHVVTCRCQNRKQKKDIPGIITLIEN